MTIDKSENMLVSTNSTFPAVIVDAVSKKLRGHQVLENIDLLVGVGETIGIYGANGSGKSMLLRVISGLVLPDTGTVSVFGEKIGRDTEFPSEMGALIDGPGFLLDYTGMYNLELLASIRNRVSKAEIRKVIDLVDLDADDSRPVKTYSTGMRQRLGIAQAILENPKLVLLDEPTSALDADGTKRIHNLLRELQSAGVTIIIVSHKSDEIEGLCSHVFEMRAGSIGQRT
jgi:ABC-2 type transport system ATP-binding protein